jgi:putative ABC transport system permease protein
MKRKALFKTSLREINQSKTRFLSIMGIIFLGVLVFVGLKATGPDMIKTANQYFDAQKLPDARIVSTLGLTDKDLSAIKDVPEVATAIPRYTTDVTVDKENYAVKFIGYQKNANQLAEYELVSGKMPEKSGEIVLDEIAKTRKNYRLNETVTIAKESDPDQTLKVHTYKIVGFVKSSEYIENNSRGNTTVGKGTLDFFALVPQSDFDTSAYSEILLTFKNLKNLDSYSDNYIKLRDQDVKAVKKALGERPEQRVEEIKAEAQPAIEKAKEEIAAGEKALKEGADQLAASKQTLEAGQAQYAASLQDYQTQIAQAENQLVQSQTTINEGAAQLALQKNELAQKEQQLAAASTQVVAGQNALPGLQNQRAQLAASQQQLTAVFNGYQSLAASVGALQELEDAYVPEAVQAQGGQWQTMLQQVQAPPELVAAVNQLIAQPQKNQIAGVMNAVNNALPPITTQQNEVAAGLAQVDAGIAKIQQGIAQYQQGQQQIEAAHNQIAAAQAQLDESQAAVNAGYQQLEQSKVEGQAKLAAAKQQLDEGQAAYEKGEQEYNQQKAENEKKLTSAKQQIAEKEQQLASLKGPKYYYFNRSDNPGYSEYKDNAQRISSLSTVFPLFFFLIAALVSLTTMTRMIEEKRMEIGSLKALGYRNGEIAFKFLLYATIASMTGALLGLVVGYYLFPTIIFNAYGEMYNIPNFVSPWYLSYSVMGILVAILCTVGAAMVVLRIDLFSTPAILLRPKAPKAGQRILLERITPLWNRMSFIQKVTARNLFRYKQRMLMTVLGIAGCMALLIVGFGLKDSISDIATIQFNKIWHYQGIVTFKEEATKEQTEAYQKTLAKVSDLKNAMPIVSEILETDKAAGSAQDVTIYVPEKPQEIQEYILFNDRRTGEKYQLTDEGVIINEKLAKLYHCKVGDTIALKDKDNQKYQMKIAAITENYAGHFAYMTPTYYQKIFKQTPVYNSEFLLFSKDLSQKEEAAIGKQIMAAPNVLNVSFLSALSGSMDSMLASLNIVIWVLIIVSGSLALIVLYNLTNINISERIRELSTIKVLGFYDPEVTMYVYRENISLTIIGILFGCLFGKLLHGYILTTVEIDMIMFSPNIHWFSYLYSGLITMFFALLVMVIMHRKLKKIDMIEALKSNE